MKKLTDIQRVLLSTAAARDDGNLLPPRESLGALSDRIRRTITALVKEGLADEAPIKDRALLWRDDAGALIGVFITASGREAIDADAPAPDAAPTATPTLNPANIKPSGKLATVLGLLQRQQGATIEEMMSVPGWLPHSTRAALTGMRKKGHAIEKSKRGDVTCYRVGKSA